MEFLPLLLIVAVFWLLLIRPARKRQREFAAVQRALEPGRRAMMASGIYGVILDVLDDEVSLEIAPGVVVTVHRQAIGRVIDESIDEPVPDTDENTN